MLRRLPTGRGLPAVAVVVALLLGATACSDDDDASPSSTSTSTSISVPQDPTLTPLALRPADLPAGFTAVTDADDTITAFCAGEDATAGLRASGRALVGLKRDPPGASVIHLVFRFEEEGAARFVEQAGLILDRCSSVPDATGLAFDYEPIGAGLDELVAPATDAHVTRHGVSVGSGSLRIDLALFHRGDVGELVAVLGVDLPREELDLLAAAAFTAAVARLAASP
jgi:hypothetical protein